MQSDKSRKNNKYKDKYNDESVEKLKIPPHSIEAEQSVIGSMLIAPDSWDKVAEIVIESDFYNRSHQVIYQSILKLLANNQPVDVITTSEHLEQHDKLDEAGGFAYLAELAKNTPSAANVVSYAKIIKERAIVRELIGVAHEIAEVGYNPEGRDSADVLDMAESRVFEIAEKRTGENEGPRNVESVLGKTIDRLEQLVKNNKAVTGVSTGFVDLDKKTSGMQPSDLIIVAARPSMGKCIVSGSQLVDPTTGALNSIDDLVAAQHAPVLSVDNRFKCVAGHASEFVDDGLKPVFRVTTALGKSIETTLTHPFLTGNGWQPLSEINTGEQIAIPRNLPIFGQCQPPEHEIKAIAYMMSDASEAQSLRAQFAALLNSCITQAKISSKALASSLPMPQTYTELCAVLGTEFTRNTHSLFEQGSTQINPVKPLLLNHDLDNKQAHEKSLAAAVFTWTKPCITLLLNQMFACDGGVFIQSNNQVRVSYGTTSSVLAQQIQHLLLRFGIIAKLRSKSSNYSNAQPHYEVEVLDKPSIIKFINDIGVLGESQQCAAALALLQQESAESNVDSLPLSANEYVLSLKGDRSWPSIFAAAGKPMPDGFSPDLTGVSARHLSRHRAQFYADLFADQYLSDLANSDVYWDKITAIEYQGHKQVYDLTVPDLHNFIAQDIFVHNTTFAMNLAENAMMLEDKPVLVFSLEMPSEQLMMRMLASLSRVDQTKIRTAQLDDDDWARISNTMAMLKDKDNLFIDDSSGLTPMDVRSRARKLARDKGGISMIMIDYLQLMRVPSLSDNRTLEIAEISRSLKALAKELEVPVIALSQLNRSLEQRADKRPINSDLRESGSIEQDADLIMFIYRDEVYNENSEDKGVSEIIIGKQRNGPIGTSRLAFQGQFSRFDNYTGPERSDDY
ncbi:MAG: replicative DNA helicase [Glaciecola sp.]|nr:replicative DNA helicase [Glaciecola sp.]